MNEWARKREEEDEAAPEDPEKQALPVAKGLKYYWLSTNTWSVDGLPGMKSVEPLASAEIKKTTMEKSGLQAAVATQSSLTPGWVLGYILGLLMGMLLPMVLRRGMLPSLRDLDLAVGRRLLEYIPRA